MVALEQAVAVPLATRHLVDLGADVIKIERPGARDFARDYDTRLCQPPDHVAGAPYCRGLYRLDRITHAARPEGRPRSGGTGLFELKEGAPTAAGAAQAASAEQFDCKLTVRRVDQPDGAVAEPPQCGCQRAAAVQTFHLAVSDT
jgi:CoA-transferase family III